MFSIGEFSTITGLTVKTLRFYQEEGVLIPSCVDDQTGYRYYDAGKVEIARVIAQLRKLEFPLAAIAEILRECDDDNDLLAQLESRRAGIADKLRQYKETKGTLDQIISAIQKTRSAMSDASLQVTEKTLEPMLIAGVRMRGKYSECGQGFRQVGRMFGRHICGPPMMLIYDTEFKENDADFEACMPVRKGESTGEVQVRELPGGRCVSVLHKGPYDECGRSYERLLTFIKEKGYETTTPCREVYIKGPGMIFKGNPKNYLTEIQMMVRE
jgi:DNA-binding transcriptional MerR regulator/effector-binding domain-containing protein